MLKIMEETESVSTWPDDLSAYLFRHIEIKRHNFEKEQH